MKKHSLIFPLLFLSFALFAQVPAKLPSDPRVKSGTLSNGLSYIVIKNQAQKNQAHFCVAQKVGTSLEKEGTFGFFTLLQQLATKGTRNFEGSSITDYLKKIGVGSENLIFTTEADRTSYLIRDVPVGRAATIDSSLLILYNWMSSINVDEGDIAAERQNLAINIVRDRDAAHRLNHSLIEALYPDSPYSEELKVENLRQLSRINSRDLRSFYYNWCRPDLQCVIVVGDIDPDKLETQIKSIFSTIPKPLRRTSREYFIPQEFEGVKSVVLQDEEYANTKLSISLLKAPLKEEFAKTNIPYIQEFMDDMAMRILSDRITQGAISENQLIYDLEVTKGKFLGMEKSLAYTISYSTLPSAVYASSAFVSNQIRQLASSGATQQEFKKTTDIYWKNLESSFDTREQASNDSYLQRALNSYYDGFSLASTEMHFEIVKQVLFSMGHNKFNEYLSALYNQTNNIVISCYMPKAEGVSTISNERLNAAYTNYLGTPASTEKAVVWPNVSLLRSSDVVTQSEDSELKAEKIVLTNGATLLFKNIDNGSDTLMFRGVSRGGYSKIGGANIGNAAFFNGLLEVAPISNISYADMNRLYTYNHIGLKSKLLPNREVMEGFALPASAEKLMQAIYLNMTAREKNKHVYDMYVRRVLYDIQYQAISPLAVFRDSVYRYIYSNPSYGSSLTAEQLNRYDYNRLHNMVSNRFSNAADFVFMFAGKNASLYKEAAIRYIGAIPGNKAAQEEWDMLPSNLTKGKVQKRFLMKMAAPRSYVSLTLSSAAKYNSKNALLAELTQRYVENLFNDRLNRGIPNYNIKSALDYYPEQLYSLSVVFESDSARAQSFVNEIVGSLQQVAKEKISERDFKLLAIDLSGKLSALQNNSTYWLDKLENKYLNSLPMEITQEQLAAITKKEFAAFVKKLLDSNQVTVIMDGTTADVQTQRLLQENEFIRDFFDVD